MSSFNLFVLLGVLCALGLHYSEAVGTPFLCSLPAKKGGCKKKLNRFFFNTKTGECESFVFRGCRGNENSFKTKEECMRTCAPDNICSQPYDMGFCGTFFTHWFYDSITGKCETFLYGGYGGNDNNFKTEDDCKKFCLPKPGKSSSSIDPICFQPYDSDVCRTYFEHWFYNSINAKCESFLYGGFSGNDNNFKTEDECKKRCAA